MLAHFLRLVLTAVLLFVGFVVIGAVLSILIKLTVLVLMAAGVYYLLTRSSRNARTRANWWRKN